MAGTIGHLFILIAFVATGLSGFAFFRAAQYPTDPIDWKRIGRVSWVVMTVMVVAAWAILVYLIATHQFQYAYVHQQSSRDLPVYYLFSASWAGQEGSFLLWIMLTGVVGLTLIKWAARSYEAPVMAIIAFCQLFLVVMIVGLQFGPLSIGASPFMSIAERFPDAPIFQANPDFIPADGSGLNDLLQNYWMVIHPPTLFVGFSTMIVPFAFAVAALWKRRYTEWVRPAMPWTLFSVMILGVGIAMGGYWAYETLSFGGYWAWDPVENSSLVPWIVGVAAIHMMLIQRKSGNGHKGALFLSILAYMLVIYSTFLTRSGILGDMSVHSFVDLGLYNQLLLWILAMGVVGFGLFAYRYKELPTPTKEPHYLSREFMIFSGAMLLCAVAAVVILGTSSPIFGRIFRDSPATVPIEFYNEWTLPLAVLFVFLAGLGQLFWWNRMSVENVNRVLLKPIALSVVSTLLILVFTPFVEGTIALQPENMADNTRQAALMGGFWETYGLGLLLLLLLFVAFFAFYGNGLVLWRIGRGNPRMAGGAIAHVGLALMVLGIIASSGFSNPLSNTQPLPGGRENFVLEQGKPQMVEGYRVEYVGQEPAERGRVHYVLNFADSLGRSFTVKPVVYKSNKDQWIQHPDLHVYPTKDIFVAVTPRVQIEDGQGTQTAQGGEITVARGDSVVLGSDQFKLTFVTFDTNVDSELLPENAEVAVAAVLNVTNLATREMRELRPIYVIKQDRSVEYIQNRMQDWDLAVTFTKMNVDNGSINLAIDGVEVMPEDWVVVQAYEKPLITLLWIGILVLTGGFLLSIYRRIQDVRLSERRSAVSG